MGNKRPRINSYKKKTGFSYKRIISYARFSFKIIAGISVVLGMSIFFILIHDFLTQSDYFRINNITVTGAYRFQKKQIIKQADLEKGTNILSINMSLMRKKLLANPSIAEAEIIRYLPDSIFIRIKEHRPLAVLDFGRKFIINKNGEIFKEMENTDPHDLPLITGLKVHDTNRGGGAGSLYYDTVMEVLKLGQKRGSPVPLGDIKKIHVDKEMGLTLYIAGYKANGMHEIKLGYSDYTNKYKSLAKVYLYFKKTSRFLNFCSIDLNNLNRIVLTPADNNKEGLVTTSAIKCQS